MMSIKKSSAFKALKFLYVLPVVCAGLAVNARPVYDSPEKCAESYKLSGDITVSVAGDSVSVAEFLPDNVDVYVDGKAVSRKDLGTLDPEKISSVNVIKTGDGNAIQVFTVAYSTEPDAPKKDLNIRILESGDSELATAGTVKSIHVIGKDGVKIEGKEQPDFYVDGEKVSYESFREMSPDDFVSIVVSKPDGPDGKGRIDITTKK